MIVLAIALFYVIAWRPARAVLSEKLIKPVTVSLVESQPGKVRLQEVSRSVNFNLYLLDENGRPYREVTFGFPWGFYTFFPLILLVFLDRTGRFTLWHLIIQAAAGFLMIVFFLAALSVHLSLIHLYLMLVTYIIPGGAFLILLFAITGGDTLKRLLGQENQSG